MAKNDARKSFVAARLKETGKEATPEQRAIFRARFDLLSQTQKGRTTIAQKVLPQGTATERAAFKKSIRPTQTNNTGESVVDTGETTTKRTDSSRNSGFGVGGVINNVNLPSNNTSTSALVRGVPSGRTRFRDPQIVAPYTRTTKDSNFFEGLPGTQSWKDRPGLTVADIPLGAGKLITGLQEAKKGNFFGGLGHAIAGGVELGFTIASAMRGKPITRTGTVIPSVTRNNTTQLFTAKQNFDLAKMQKAMSTYAPGVKFTPSAITGANRPTSMPFAPSFAPQRGSAAQAFAPKVQPSYVNYVEGFGVPVNTPNVSATPVATPSATLDYRVRRAARRQDKINVWVNPPAETPVATPVATPAKPKVTKPPAETPAKTPSPPNTIAMKYDLEGNRLNQEGKSVTDPTSDAGLRGWRPGDAKPKAPPIARTKNKTTTEWQDYQYRLDAYNKYHNIVPKKK